MNAMFGQLLYSTLVSPESWRREAITFMAKIFIIIVVIIVIISIIIIVFVIIIIIITHHCIIIIIITIYTASSFGMIA